ncbi:two-component regulator propeller domain-containing protein [Loktanella salsilacus]|uniref:two-component regulator propeller domain-containing protein n=1 Tax=Loktanella salsilacus TaxID=195913 RepID=UPI0037353BDC
MCQPVQAETQKSAIQLTINDGMSQSTVNDILQADDGRMWFATGDGLSLYDGESFHYVYRAQAGQPGLANNYTFALARDHAGLIWVGTLGGGITVFDQQVTPVASLRAASGLIGSDEVFDLAPGPDGSMWVAHGRGVTQLQLTDGAFAAADGPKPADIKADYIRSLAVGPDGGVYIGTGGAGLYHFAPGSGRMTHWDDTNSALTGLTVLDVLIDTDGSVWIATEDAGLHRLTPATGVIDQPLAIPDTDVEALAQGQDGRLWVGTWSNGIYVYDAATGRLENYRSRRGVRQRISSDTIVALTPGALGRMWIGTYDNGASSVSQSPDLFETYYPQDSGVIWALADAGRDGVWIGGKDGLLRLDRNLQNLTMTDLAKDLGPGPHDVRAILQEPDGVIIAVRDHGLQRRKAGQLTWTRLRAPDGTPVAGDAFIRLLLRAADGTLWIGTHTGVFHIAPDGRQLAHYVEGSGPGNLPHNRTRSLYQGPDGTVWIGTSGGLSRWNADAGDFTTVSGPAYLPDNDVRAIWQAAPGQPLYVGTQGGIAVLDETMTPIRQIGRAEGLPNETIYKILPGASGDLWLTTNNGLARLDPGTDKVDVFRASDGLQGAEFNFNAGAVLDDGVIAVGGIDGFSLFDPREIHADRSAPLVSAAWERQPDSPVIAPFGVSVDLSVIQYDKPVDNMLRWRLLPRQPEWTTANGVRHRIGYQLLEAGDYQLEYQGVSAAGVASDPVAVAFTVMPPFTQRWWAWACYAAIAAGGLVIVSRLRTRQVRARNRNLEQIVAAKTAELAQQNAKLAAVARDRAAFYARTVHEIRTPLSLISAPLDHALRLPDLPAEAQRLIQLVIRAAARMTMLTQQMADTAGTPEGLGGGRATLDLASFVQPIIDFYGEMAQERKLRFTATTPPAGATTLDPSACDALLHNLLSNAVRHTPEGGAVTVQITAQAHDLTISVSNTAPLPQHLAERLITKARDAEPSKGIDIIAQSVLRLDGKLSISSGPLTTLQVVIPCDTTLAQNAPLPPRSDSPVPLETTQDDGPTILIVEDDSDLRGFLAELLAGVGQIRAVGSLAAARRALDRHPVHLVLCDVMLPDGRAFDFGKALKAHKDTAQIGLIFLTALQDDAARSAAQEAWADDYLTKPFDPQDVMNKVQLRLRAAERVQTYVMDRLVPDADQSDSPPPPVLAPFDRQLLDRLDAFIRSAVSQPDARIEDAAMACGVSTRVLQRKIDALCPQPFNTLLADRRMQHAGDLLRQGQMTVTDIAAACGYRNLSSFSRRFKAFHGQSPRDYAALQSSRQAG